MGPCAHHRHHQQRNDSTHLNLILSLFLSLFLAISLWWRILHRYASTNRRRTETFAQSNFYAQILLHREVVRRLTFTRRRLYTQRLSRNEMFTQKFLHTDVLHRGVFAHIIKAHRRFYTQNLLYRETFAQNSFYTKKLLHWKTLTQKKKLSTQTAQKKYTPKLSHADTLPRAILHIFFPPRSLYAQKSFCTAVFTQTLLHTDAFTQKHFYTKICAHSTLFYTQPVFTRKCFASPSSSPTFRVPPLKYIQVLFIYYIYYITLYYIIQYFIILYYYIILYCIVLYYAWMPVIPSKIGFEPNPERKRNVSKISLVTNQHTAICI